MFDQIQKRFTFGQTLTTFILLIITNMNSINGQVSISPAGTTNGMAAPSSGTPGLSYTLSPSYAGMGFEPSNLFAFTGTSSPNPLTMNLMNNLANYTGAPPHIRVGGNTGDTALYNSSYTGYGFQDNPSTTGPTDVAYYGPNFMKVINYFPKGTPVTYGLPMAYNGPNAKQMREEITQEVINSLTNVRLYSFEVGNEPDLYPQNQFRDSTWDSSDYGTEWSSDILDLYQTILQPKGIQQAVFETACTATTAKFHDYRISDLVTTQVATATNNGQYIGGWNQHNYYYYVGVSGYTLTLNGLLNLGITVSQLQEWQSQTQQAITTGKPYYLREMGSVGPNGLQGISNTFGNALWTLNFFLYASTVGIQSVQMHFLQDSFGSAWQPIVDQSGNSPFVRPSYAAWAAFAQINGAGCQTQIAPIALNNVPSNYQNRLVAYGAYDNGNLQTIIMINTNPANQSWGSENFNTQQISVTLPTSLVGRTFYMSLMTAPGSDATNGTSWNGMTYEYNNGVPQKASENTISNSQVGSGGILTFNIRDSQAVVANLDSQIGTQNTKVDSQACSKFNTSIYTSKSGSGFKATSGFASNSVLSLGAIIGIAAGGGSALLILLGLIIFCCVRRARKRRLAKYSDSSSLLPPTYGGKKARSGGIGGQKQAPYKTVPINDMADSSDDIFMLPVGKGGKNIGYNSMNSISTAGGGGGSPFRGHKHTDSYGSATPSMTNSPLLPGSPNFGSRARVDSYSSENAIPPSVPANSRYNGQQQQQGGGGYGSSNLNPNSRSGHSSNGHSGENAAMAVGGAASGYFIAKKMNEQGNVRRGQPQPQPQQQQQQRNLPQPSQNQFNSNNNGTSQDPWQQFAQQHPQQNMLSPPNQYQQGYQQQQGYGQDGGRGRYSSTPNASAAEAGLGLAGAGAGIAAGQQYQQSHYNQQGGQQQGQMRTPERRKSLPSNNDKVRNPSSVQQSQEKRRSRQLPQTQTSASSQGHGYRHSLDHQTRPRPPVPELPASVRSSLPVPPSQRPSSRDKSQSQQRGGTTTNSAALDAAHAAIGGTSAAQNAYQAQRQQYQSQQQNEMSENNSTNYGMAMTTNSPHLNNNQDRSGSHERTQSIPALLDPNAYAVAAQPRSSSEMAFYRQVDPAGVSAQAYGGNSRQQQSPPRPSRAGRPPIPQPPTTRGGGGRNDGPPGYAQ